MRLVQIHFFGVKMKNPLYLIAKQVIREGIKNKITFDELREKLPGWRKRALQSIIFDVMAELNMTTVPFPGLLKRPRLTRKPIPVDEEGKLSVKEIIAEKWPDGRACEAFANIGDKKITLTIKPKKLINLQGEN